MTAILIALTLVLVAIAVSSLRPSLIVDHPRCVILALVAASAVAGTALVDFEAGELRMSLDPSEEPMLPDGDPAQDVYDTAVANFGNDDLYVIAMHTPDVFTAANLAAMRGISNAIRRLEGVRGVESLVETIAYRYIADLDLVEVSELVDDLPQTPAAVGELRERALTDPIYPKVLVAPDARTAALNVSFKPMSDGEFVRAGLDDSISDILGAALSSDGEPGRDFFVTGRQHVKSLTHTMMVGDLTRLIPLAVIVGASVARIVTGSLRSAVIPVGSSLVATLWVFGALAWLGRPLTLLGLVLAPTLICVGSVYGVHVMAKFDELAEELAGATGAARTREQAHAAALACLRYTRTPVLIAGATTFVGFGALLLSDTPAVRELGTCCALGVLAVTMLSLTGVPALLSLLRPRSVDPRSTFIGGLISAALERIAAVPTNRPGAVLIASAVIAAAALAWIPRIVVDTDYLTFFDATSRVRTDFTAISENLVGAVPIYVTLDGKAEGALREPDNLRALENLQARIDALPGVTATVSMVDVLRVMNRAVEKDDPAAERIPDTRGEVAELLFLIPKNKMRQFANANHSRANIVVRTGLSGSAAVLDLESRLHEAIAEADLPEVLEADVTGNAIVVNHGANGIAANQVSTVGAAALTILILVSQTFRSVRIGTLAMIPNVLPVLIFFGILGAGAAPLSLPTSLIGCIALGIAIDDTAHFLVGYRARRDAGSASREAAADCIRTLGRPITTTSLMLIAGFLVLSASGFATLREFGYLSALTMFVCLAADLLLLPAILVRAKA